jgi:hypothetical protein
MASEDPAISGFLLVFRTHRIVTAANAASTDAMLGFSSIQPDAHRAVSDAGGNDLP